MKCFFRHNWSKWYPYSFVYSAYMVKVCKTCNKTKWPLFSLKLIDDKVLNNILNMVNNEK